MDQAKSPVDTEEPIGRLEWISATVYSIALLWINLYICRNLFYGEIAPMNSMHGFWAAIARLADGSWFQTNWWPYWDCGIPFEFTYAPLVPLLTAIGTAVFSVSPVLALQFVASLAYSLGPVTLFLMAWLMTRAPGYSFLAGLFYSLTAISQILLPDGPFSWRAFLSAKRLYLTAFWDDTPHALALVFVPLAILFLSLSIRKRRIIYYAAASVSIGAATLASAFGPTVIVMASICLLFVLRRHDYKRNVILVGAIGAYGYALSAHFLPPALLHAIRVASLRGEAGNWSVGSASALLLVISGWLVLWRYLPRWTRDWRLQFFVLFAYLMSSLPVLATFLNVHLLPQPNRYKPEMEVAWAVVLIFAVQQWMERGMVRAPRMLKTGLLLLCLALAGAQIVSLRRYAKGIQPVDLERTIEYRAARWADLNLPGTRMMMPGSIAQWTNAATGVQQFGGASWSMAYNPIQQRGLDAAFFTSEKDARVSVIWLKAYGVGAMCVTGPTSPEFWKPYQHPTKFEGMLPVLWREEDTTIYRIPQRTTSLAHVVPQSALVPVADGGPEVSAMERYGAALDDSSLPAAEFRWEGRNRILIHTTAQPEQVVSVQVSWHPGWHATSAGAHKLELQRDGLGLIWLRPNCNGPCDVRLEYSGGRELRLSLWISLLAIAGLAVILPFWYFRSRFARSEV